MHKLIPIPERMMLGGREIAAPVVQNEDCCSDLCSCCSAAAQSNTRNYTTYTQTGGCNECGQCGGQLPDCNGCGECPLQ
jgi:hypothetical protein